MQVLLTTPTTPEDRMKEITEASEGFVYLVSTSTSQCINKMLKIQIVFESLAFANFANNIDSSCLFIIVGERLWSYRSPRKREHTRRVPHQGG
jgi:hypothetical protein